jgi:hypothetical protein
MQEGHLKKRWFISEDEQEIYFAYKDVTDNIHAGFTKQAGIYDTRGGQRYT